jgi:hypothetical protein
MCAIINVLISMPKEAIREKVIDENGVTLEAKIEAAKEARAATEREIVERREFFAAEKKKLEDMIAARTEELENAKEKKWNDEETAIVEKKELHKTKNTKAVGRMAKAGKNRPPAPKALIVEERNIPEESIIVAPKPEKKKRKISFGIGAEALANREGMLREAISGIPVSAEAEKPAVTVEREPYSTPSPFEGMQPEVRDSDGDLIRLAERYEQKGFKEVLANLSVMPEFEALTSGQKMLVIQGMGDRLHGRVKEMTAEAFEREQARSGMFKKLLRNSAKPVLMAKHEKEVLKKLLSTAGAKVFVEEDASELVTVFGSTKLEAYLGKGGEVLTDFAQIENPTPLMQGLKEEYNVAASKLSRIPAEWGLSTATRSERKQYKEAQNAFDIARDRFLPELEHLAGQYGVDSPKFAAAERVAQGETYVRLMSQLSTHPEALKRIDGISNKWLATRALETTYVERGGALGLGITLGASALRKLSFVASPIIGGVVGYYRGQDRAKKALIEADKRARRGGVHDKDTTLRMGVVTTNIDALQNIEEKLAYATSPIEQQKYLNMLARRVDYIESHLQNGQINFGAKDQFLNQYKLMMALHTSRTTIQAMHQEPEMRKIFTDTENPANDTKNPTNDNKIRERLLNADAKDASRVQEARGEKISREAWRSAKIGAVAGTIGAALGYFGRHFHWTSESVTETVPGVKKHISSVMESSKIEDTAVTTSPVRVIPKTPQPLETLPSATPESAPIVDVENVAAKVEFSSKGINQTILNFRHSPNFKNLSPEEQKFFQGNVAKIAEKLHGFRPDALDSKESLSVGEGSKFGVTPDGKIFVTDALHGGKPTILGHFENGEFVSEDAEGLTYIDTDSRPKIVEKSTTMSVRETPEGKGELVDHAPRTTPEALGLRAQTPEEVRGPIADGERYGAFVDAHRPKGLDTASVISPEMQKQVAEYNKDLHDIDPAYVSYNDPHEYTLQQELTQGKMDRISRRADRLVRHQVNRFFTVRNMYGQEILGQYSPTWLSYANAPARSILNTDLGEVQPSFRPFIRHMRVLADKYPEVDRTQALGYFMKECYAKKAAEKVL